jgi:hypothetical protein
MINLFIYFMYFPGGAPGRKSAGQMNKITRSIILKKNTSVFLIIVLVYFTSYVRPDDQKCAPN